MIFRDSELMYINEKTFIARCPRLIYITFFTLYILGFLETVNIIVSASRKYGIDGRNISLKNLYLLKKLRGNFILELI